LWWAVTFTDPAAASIGGAPLGVPLHPVQLHESMVCLANLEAIAGVRSGAIGAWVDPALISPAKD
jgi:hypothetical protein